MLLLLYGLCAIGAGLNFPAWLRLAWLRWRVPERVRPWWRDTLFLGRGAIALTAFGACGLSGLRTVAALIGEAALQVPSPLGLLFIGCMAAAEPFFLRIDEIHKSAAGGHSLLWQIYFVAAVAWSAIALTILILP